MQSDPDASSMALASPVYRGEEGEQDSSLVSFLGRGECFQNATCACTSCPGLVDGSLGLA